MAWLKRNPGLVAGGLLALALMGFAGFYLWKKIQHEKSVTMQLEEANQRFNSLLRRKIHPGNEEVNNIERAKEQVGQLKVLLTEVRAKIGTNETPTKISNQEFRALLDNTITELQRDAQRLGVTLPAKDYWFTFAPQKTLVEFNATDMLMQQLMDIKALTEILYEAKIHDLTALKRVPAATEDNNQTDFLGDKKPTTNEVAIVTPYEVTFNGFSSELAKVLEGLINADRCFVVKSVGVEKATDPQPDPMMNPYGTGYPMNSGLAQRYGRYMPRTPVYTQPVRRPSGVLLDEQKLKFVLTVDAVRLKPSAEQRVAQADPNAYMGGAPQ